jgi:hypothetical protein
MEYIEARAGRPAPDDASTSAEAESLRATVTLLRSVAPATAPRTFALTPEQATSRPPARIYRPAWYMRAPALGAAAAVFALVFLVIGDVAGGLRQSGPEPAQSGTASDAFQAKSATSGSLEPDVPAAELSLASTTPSDASLASRQPEAGGPATVATASPAAGIAGLAPSFESTPAPDSTLAGTSIDSAVPVETPAGVAEASNTGTPEPFSTPPADSLEIATGPAGPAGPRGQDQAELAPGEGGFAMPLWQIELALGLAAAGLAGAWAFMRASRGRS